MSSYLKSGLIFGAINFITTLGVALLIPLCTPVCGIIWGVGAGLLTIYWAEPDSPHTPARAGGIAGGIAGVGALLGVMIGGLISFYFMGGQDAAAILSESFGTGGMNPNSPAFQVAQTAGAVGMICCIGLVNIGIMAGVSALSAHLYASNRAKNVIT